MYDIQLLDKSKKIIKIRWIERVTPEEVQEVNDKLEQLYRELPSPGFDVLVDMKGMAVLLPATQKAIVAHQADLLKNGMGRAAVIVDRAIAKMQLNRTAKESNHQKEFHFETEEEALSFLHDSKVS